MKQTTHPSALAGLNRRRLLLYGAATAAATSLPIHAAHAQEASPVAADDVPVSGEATTELSTFDTHMTDVLATWHIPGGQLAIARDNRLVYNRGFGYASVEDQQPVKPESRF